MINANEARALTSSCDVEARIRMAALQGLQNITIEVTGLKDRFKVCDGFIALGYVVKALSKDVYNDSFKINISWGGGDMVVKVVGQDTGPKKATCYKCGAILEYWPIDVQLRKSMDYTWCVDMWEEIVCPQCQSGVKV